MKAKLFGGSKKQNADASIAYHSPLPEHRASSPGYSQPIQASASQSSLQRSPSLRQGPNTSQPRPPAEGAGHASREDIRALEQRTLENRSSAYFNSSNIPPAGQPSAHEKEQKRGLRDKIFGGHSHKASQDTSSNNKSGVGRSLSVNKRKELQNPEKYYSQTNQEPRAPYQRRSANSSQNLLNTHTEEDEDSQHNLYAPQASQQQFQGAPPPPPAKERDYEPQYPQQVAPPQAYYQDPRSIIRVNTDSTSNTHIGNVDLRSPVTAHDYQYEDEDESYYHQRQDQYTTYQAEEDAASSSAYRSSAEEQARQPYSQQPPSYAQHQRMVSGQVKGQPDLHFAQSGPGRPSLDKFRPPSQGPRQANTQQERSDSQNPLFLQAPNRGSTYEQPPSPLVPAGPPPGLQNQSEPQPPPSPHPPSTAESAQSTADIMPQGNQPRGNNTLRQVSDKSAGFRDSSGMHQPPPPPPHKQGLAAFASNQVPTGSQGAPTRGPQAAAAAAAAAANLEGRESPVPKGIQMAPAELVDEEAAGYLQLQKEYKELREKYQKVKKYYFEKEAQVHQLQNTLAHQRLSASRTSLDDSEYVARFIRLDGLISQLAFSIRKSWKTIPDFLQRGVNKDALLTGKQEMTAVGKAYMSHWLVANLFDMYFHPSLELGLSRDLKEIWHNVRRYCPPFQSGEEEEALNAKLVNWRMTTVDGLQDRLRAPEAASHHARLVEMLNDKMVSDMSLQLTDPAPPDLAGGVSMIIELAVAVAQHIPMESRDVSIEYYYPGTNIAQDMMKTETGIPALTNPINPSETSPSSVGDAGDRASLKSTDTRDSSDMRGDDGPSGAAAREEKKARGMFGGLMSGSGGAKVQKNPPTSVGPPVVPSKPSGRETPIKEERVRLCVGISVQIRGRSVLAKAPVYGMA